MTRERDLERLLSGDAGPELHAQLRERARHDEGLRRVYDDYFDLLAAFEAMGTAMGTAMGSADSELEVEDAALPTNSREEARWLETAFFEAYAGEAEGARDGLAARLARARTGWLGWLALAAAVLVGLIWAGRRVELDTQPEDRLALGGVPTTGLVARGRGRSAELELELLCGLPPKPVNAGRCGLDMELGFAARSTSDDASPRVLSVFGVDAAGDVMFYAPTPADAAGIDLVDRSWKAVDFTVRLATNHQAGPMGVFAILAPRAATVDEIEAWADQLQAKDGAELRRPWTESLAERAGAGLEALCPDADACEAVQTQIQLVDRQEGSQP